MEIVFNKKKIIVSIVNWFIVVRVTEFNIWVSFKNIAVGNNVFYFTHIRMCVIVVIANENLKLNTDVKKIF